MWETLPVLAGNRKLLVCLGRVLLPETIILCGAQTVHQVTVKIKTILQFKRLGFLTTVVEKIFYRFGIRFAVIW